VAREKYSWDDVAEKTLGVYEEVLGSVRLPARQAASVNGSQDQSHP
jgi:hypothetical protein